MKNKTSVILLIVCAVLCTTLLVSVFSLRAAKADMKELEVQLTVLAKENDQLSNLNQALRLQLDSMFLNSPSSTYIEEDYCALLVDSWSESEGILSFDAFAQLFLTVPVEFTARLELWRGDTVFATQPITLNATEADTVFEANLSTSFSIPKIGDGEELQLWLMVEPANGAPLFACAASWSLENDELLIITG